MPTWHDDFHRNTEKEVCSTCQHRCTTAKQRTCEGSSLDLLIQQMCYSDTGGQDPAKHNLITSDHLPSVGTGGLLRKLAHGCTRHAFRALWDHRTRMHPRAFSQQRVTPSSSLVGGYTVLTSQQWEWGMWTLRASTCLLENAGCLQRLGHSRDSRRGWRIPKQFKVTLAAILVILQSQGGPRTIMPFRTPLSLPHAVTRLVPYPERTLARSVGKRRPYLMWWSRTFSSSGLQKWSTCEGRRGDLTKLEPADVPSQFVVPLAAPGDLSIL